MKRAIGYSILLAFGSALAGCATPQPSVYMYPAKGQSVEQVSRDQADCQAWAKQQTGFDPAMDTAKGAGVGAAIGAVGGAAAGAAMGAAGGNAGTGAAVGAVAGGLGGAGIGAAVGYARSKEGYDKAYATCLSTRGYAVAGQPQVAAAPPPPPPQVVAAPPPVVIQSPPQLVVVPGTPVYYAPGLNVNFFYYGGRYYTHHSNAWFVSTVYNGPWTFVATEYVPQPVLGVPVQYYKVPPGHWKKHGPPPWAGPKKWKDDD